jgi:LysR family transcriptional regulator, regulator of abg operon
MVLLRTIVDVWAQRPSLCCLSEQILVVANMELKQVEHFLAVLETGSLSRAATTVGLTQQALSKSLMRLETQIGGPVFERGPKGMILTPLGRALVDQARIVRSEARRLSTLARSTISATDGRIVIGLSPIAEAGAASGVIAKFAEACPRLAVDIVGGDDFDFMRAILAGEMDLAVCIQHLAVDPMIHARQIGMEEWLVVARDGHPLLSVATSLKDLANARWMVGRSSDVLFGPVARDFRASGFDVPSTGMFSTLVRFSFEALRQSDVIYIMPKTFAMNEPGIMARRLAPSPWLTPLAIFTRRSSQATAGLQPLLSALAEAYAALES